MATSMPAEFIEWLNEHISWAEDQARKSHSDAASRYEAGYDKGFYNGLVSVRREIERGDKP